MYQLLTHPTTNIPSVISTFSSEYPDFIHLGYSIKAEGTQRKMNDLFEEIMNEQYSELLTDIN